MEQIIEKIIAFFAADDKQKHILAIALIASWTFIVMLAFIPAWWSFALAIIVVAIAGYSKEYYIDAAPDLMDLVADAIGLLLSIIVMLIYLLN